MKSRLALAALTAIAPLALSAQADTGRAHRGDTIPARLGSLRRDNLSIQVQVQGLTARAVPLEEEIIRTLAPDTYATLHALRISRAAAIEKVRTRLGLAAVQTWHVSFFNVQAGEARFDPRGMQLRSAGRDFRPLEVISLQPGFEDGRLAQGRSVDAIFIFDPAVSLMQPLVVTLAGVQSSSWDEALLLLVERERSAIWSRAAAGRKP